MCVSRSVAGHGILLATMMLAACGSGSSGPGRPAVTIVINAPFGRLPYVGKFSLQGAQLAADQINKDGGVKVGSTEYSINIEKMDNDLSPATSLDNIKKAIAEKAVAVIDDGYTVDATYQAAGASGLPILVDYDSNAGLIDTDKRPNVFRIAPPNDALAAKLAAYVGRKNLKLAIVHDDSEYGKDGDAQLNVALQKAGLSATPDIELASSATTFDTEALQVRQSGATGVLLWARSPVLAAFLRAYRQGGGTGQVFTGPTAEDPIVRSQNADHPAYVNGLVYASFRITTEKGAQPWDQFRRAYEEHNFNNGGPDYKVGVKASDQKDVVQPPDWQIFPYDMVRLVKAALEKNRTLDLGGNKMIDALNSVTVASGNGDSRGWTKTNHEGVVDDDIYFATFQDMVFKPVQDDPLSQSLTPIDQR